MASSTSMTPQPNPPGTNMTITSALPTDMPRLMAILFAAFHGEAYHEYVDNVVVPPFPTPKDAAWPSSSAYVNAIQAAAGSRYLEYWQSNLVEEVFLKATDADSGEIIGWARWIVHSASRAKEVWDEELPPYPAYAETLSQAQRDAVIAFTYVSERQRREMYQGRPFLDLAMLAVDPGWQRRGAGKALLEWGKVRAREVKDELKEKGLQTEAEGLVVHIEATTAGLRLYRARGFEVCGRVHVKKEWFGGEEDEYFPFLRWRPV